ncbi:MAG: hypothetical protein PHI97_09835 [Desulfobulbus sp.]|nr:hypothetical protein [Desulfobulbus sp.]
MRCPKCGYTSFDHLEICKKCQKDFGLTADEINGTTYEAVAPLFLKITRDLEEKSIPKSMQKIDFEEIELDEEEDIPLRPGIDTEFTLDEALVTQAEQQGEISLGDLEDELVVDLDDFQEVVPRDEFTLDLENQSDEEDSQLPPIDFGDLDISDLGPPSSEEKKEEKISFQKNEPVLSVESLQSTESFEPPPPPINKKSEAKSGLEDLNFNGLDLELPSKIISKSAAGKRYLPSVKTGTALDKFDIDLGDLFSDKKK